MNNTVNMVPVDHVALCTSLATISPLPDAALSVMHITARPLLTFNGMLSSLTQYGFPTEQCEYLGWRRKLEQHVMEAPDLNDTNTASVLRPHMERVNMTVDDKLMGKYLAWLVRAGFLPSLAIKNPAKTLPILAEGVVKAAGRSGA
ncbi:hypothetical protein EV421DRAFT_1902727 [Armillaria borealis]|uniref:Uncharacterized protein n=1 Tax=Armillaria borealis TaxID=47425 RepID=A0AA39JNT5_9AGAR|nr:hypothetical protein EV421DRAFT_1902727 [Armillaria borealis]